MWILIYYARTFALKSYHYCDHSYNMAQRTSRTKGYIISQLYREFDICQSDSYKNVKPTRGKQWRMVNLKDPDLPESVVPRDELT